MHITRLEGILHHRVLPARAGRILGSIGLLGVLVSAAPAGAQCIGDCNGAGTVSINELILGVNIALGNAELSACPAFDPDDSGRVTIADLIAAVNAALNGCPATPTATVVADTPTATATLEPSATATGADTPTATPVATDTVEPTATATAAETNTATPSATQTAAATPTATPTSEPTATATAEAATPTVTDTAAVATPTNTAESTATATPPATASATPTPTLGEVATATATPTATFTATASPTTGPGFICGNGFIEPGETCESCAADCAIGSCVPLQTSSTFNVTFDLPPAASVTAVTFLVGYQSARVSIPGSASATSVRQRITIPQPLPNVFSPNDLDYALRLVLGRNAGFNDGLAFSVRFDQCTGATPVSAADFACTIEGCAGSGGPVSGCSCAVAAP